MNSKNYGPLQGIKVLDLSTVIAAPFGATLLGDFGAEVIKIEIPKIGDSLRNIGPFKDEEPLRWSALARNKKSLTLDLRKNKGKEILRELVKDTDIVIENFRTGTLEKWGVGYEELKKEKQDLIMLRITGFGQTGPNSLKAGFGTPATAFSGFTYLHGHKDRPPISPSFSLTDYITGIYVAFSAVAAIYYRDVNENGKGQYVDISLYESVFRMLEFLVADYDQNKIIKERTPGLSGHSSPAGSFQTKDGHWMVLVTSSDTTFSRLASAMGKKHMLTDERFHTNNERLKRFEETNGIVADWIKKFNKKDLQKKLDEYGVPISPIHSIKDIFEDDHYKARDNIVEVEHPRLGRFKMPGVIPKFSETPGAIRNIGPDLGEHTEEILKNKLNYSLEEIRELKENGII